jgi:hypothetical protein
VSPRPASPSRPPDTDEREFTVASALPQDDPGKAVVDAILSRWAEIGRATEHVSNGRSTYRLDRYQAWPSDYVLSFLVRVLPFNEISAALDDTALNGFGATPRDLGAFYHRCYDRMRERQAIADREELERLRAAAIASSDAARSTE